MQRSVLVYSRSLDSPDDELTSQPALSQPAADHIIKLLDSFSQNEYTCLVFDFYPLGSLHDEARRAKLTEEERDQVLLQGLAAVDYLHEFGFTHRDIKPENMLVRQRRAGRPLHLVLSDFGACTCQPNMRELHGSRLYMAPEVIRAQTDPSVWYDQRVDVWSLAVVVLKHGAGGLPADMALEAIEKPAIEDWARRGIADHCHRVLLVHARQHRHAGWRNRAVADLMLVHNPADRASARVALLTCRGAMAWPDNEVKQNQQQLALMPPLPTPPPQ